MIEVSGYGATHNAVRKTRCHGIYQSNAMGWLLKLPTHIYTHTIPIAYITNAPATCFFKYWLHGWVHFSGYKQHVSERLAEFNAWAARWCPAGWWMMFWAFLGWNHQSIIQYTLTLIWTIPIWWTHILVKTWFQPFFWIQTECHVGVWVRKHTNCMDEDL